MAASCRVWYELVYKPSRREKKMEKEEIQKRALEALRGPKNFEALWKLMEDAGEDMTQIELFQEHGDKKAFRAIILVNGETPVREVMELLNSRKAKK
jgi:hypothetical protein